MSEPSGFEVLRQLNEALLVRSGYFSWGHDSWIHESDEGTVLSTQDALNAVLGPEFCICGKPAVTEEDGVPRCASSAVKA